MRGQQSDCLQDLACDRGSISNVELITDPIPESDAGRSHATAAGGDRMHVADSVRPSAGAGVLAWDPGHRRP